MNTPKFIFVILRGGMDGMAAITRPGDDMLAKVRPDLVQKKTLPLPEGFAFHKAFKHAHRLFGDGDLSYIHACGLPLTNRSHFKVQDRLESGLSKAHPTEGWLARALNRHPRKPEAISFGQTLPLLLRGAMRAYNWSNPQVSPEDDALLDVLGPKLYAGHGPLEAAIMQLNKLEVGTQTSAEPLHKNPVIAARRAANRAKRAARQSRRTSKDTDPFSVIGTLVAKASGPDTGVISMGDWDTHNNQTRRLDKNFETLDAGLNTLRTTLDAVWDDTMIIITSEFGRSLAQNGTQGTDHGVGGLVMLMGGAVKGGQRFGDWPGLAPDALYMERDLYPANDIFAVFGTILEQHLGFSQHEICSDILPELASDFLRYPIFDKTGLWS